VEEGEEVRGGGGRWEVDVGKKVLGERSEEEGRAALLFDRRPKQEVAMLNSPLSGTYDWLHSRANANTIK